jgi:hypothetical protein
MWYMTTNIGGYLAPEHSYSWITPRVETQVPGAYFTIHPPANTSFISLKTISTNQEGPYTVTVDPPPYDSPVSSSYTQANPWLSMANVVMFFTALDPREMYTIKVQFTGTADQALNFVGGRVLTTTGWVQRCHAADRIAATRTTQSMPARVLRMGPTRVLTAPGRRQAPRSRPRLAPLPEVW